MKKKTLYSVIIIILLLVSSIYVIYPYYLDYLIHRYFFVDEQKPISYFNALEGLEVFTPQENFTPVAYASAHFGTGILMINDQGEYMHHIESFKYGYNIHQLYYNNSKVWIFPGRHAISVYNYVPKWIYILNSTTGEITNKIFTNSSNKFQKYCIHNDSIHVLLSSSAGNIKYIKIHNEKIINTLELEKQIGNSISKHICTQDYIISEHYGNILLYNFSNTDKVTVLTNKSHSYFTYNKKDTIYYHYSLNNQTIFVEHNITSGKESEYILNTTFNFKNFEYINNDIFLINHHDDKIFRYTFPSFKLKEIITVNNTIRTNPYFYYFGKNRYLVGSSIITIYPNKTEVINTSLPELETVHFIANHT